LVERFCMNRDQAAFLISLVLPFAILVSLSNYLKAKLAAAGYDVSHLILLGLPRKDSPNEYYGMDFSADLGGRKVLDPTTWLEFPLAKKTIISPNTAIYRFSLANPNDYLGLPVGKHISVGAEINGKEIVRSYTPISSDDQKGSFDLLIKSYEKGNISRHFSLLKVGDNIRVKGPKGQFDYVAGLTGGLGMIAGGSGITPMYQIIHAVLKNPADTTTLSLIYANVNPEDILMKEELDALAAAHPDRFKVYYVLNNPPAEWTGGVGFVSKEQIETRLPASTHDAKILMCGPPPMLTAMKKHLDELQWPAPRVVSKLADKVFLF